MGTIQIDGSTPKLTIGNATAEDATILFDGNAQDFYIALDDSADDLLIGLGSTVGTTPIIAIDENKLSTFSGAITVGVDDTGHDVKLFGATAGSFLLWDESADALLLTDSTPIQIGDAQDLTLYHDGSNSYITNKTGALKVATETSGIAVTIGHTTSEVTIADNLTVTGTVTLADGSLALADLDIDGATDIGAAIVDADLFIVDDGAGGTNRKVAASRIKTYAGGGKVLQIQSAKIASATSVTSTTATATNLTDAITPSASDSKILVMVDRIIGMSEGSGTGNVGQIQLFRDIGGAGFSNIYRAQDNASISISGLDAGTNVSSANQVSMVFLDSPSTTSACTYTQDIRLNVASASGDSINSGPSSLDSTMTLIEIGA